MARPPRVALLIECSRGYGRQLLSGIATYARTFGPWTFYHEERVLADRVPPRLTKWRPEGIIARVEDASVARTLRRLGLPTVAVLHQAPVPGIPGVMPDQESTVRLAAEHLLERRLRHFAFCGFSNIPFSEERGKRFVRYLQARGYVVSIFESKSKARGRDLAAVEAEALSRAGELAVWLRKLPKPIGLMACNDMRAYQVLSVCREHGILVPDEVAVIGVDNDALQCALCDPPLSSVDNNAQQVGSEAATLLHRLMEGRGPVPNVNHIQPIGVVTRRSTDVLAIRDREVVEIVRYVRDHACEGLPIAEMIRRNSLSRSTLERWFVKHLGRSVNDEICRVRLDRIKELLTTSDFSLGEIAKATGFAHAETMQRLFKRATGQTPGEYRRHRRVVGTPFGL